MRRRFACCLGACAAAVAMAPAARAELVYELSPTAGAGASENIFVAASGAETRVRDEFTMVGGSMRLRYGGVRVAHTLGYTLAYLRYLEGLSPTTLTQNLSSLSTFTPSARWTLRVGVGATLGRSSGVNADPTTVVADSSVAGTSQFLVGAVNEGITYQPSARWRFSQLLTLAQLRYLETPTIPGMAVSLPQTTTTALGLLGERLAGRETYSVLADLTDSYAAFDGPAALRPFSAGHTLTGRVLAGWRHEFSPTWSSSLQAGPSVIYRLNGDGVLAPAGTASLDYTSVPWFASLLATQTPAVNLYLGDAVLADQVMARLAVPITRNDRLFLGGFGGYVYARVADADGHFQRAYDHFLGGGSLTFRLANAPVAAILSYTVTSQRGSMLPGHAVNDLARQYVFITIRSDLAWGRGTPPLFGGPL